MVAVQLHAVAALHGAWRFDGEVVANTATTNATAGTAVAAAAEARVERGVGCAWFAVAYEHGYGHAFRRLHHVHVLVVVVTFLGGGAFGLVAVILEPDFYLEKKDKTVEC